MEDKDKNQEEKESKTKGGGINKKAIVMVVLGVFLLFGIAGGLAYYYLLLPGLAEAQEPEVQEPEHEYRLDNYIVNLADSDQRRYLKVSMVLAYQEEELEEELESRKAQMSDRIIDILRGKKVEDIQNDDATNRIREEVTREINSILKEGSIEEVYFTEFIIQ